MSGMRQTVVRRRNDAPLAVRELVSVVDEISVWISALSGVHTHLQRNLCCTLTTGRRGDVDCRVAILLRIATVFDSVLKPC